MQGHFVSLQPILYLLMLVSTVVIYNYVQIHVLRCLLFNSFNKRQELLVTMFFFAFANDLSSKDIERSKESAGAVSFVIVSHRTGATFLHW